MAGRRAKVKAERVTGTKDHQTPEGSRAAPGPSSSVDWFEKLRGPLATSTRPHQRGTIALVIRT